MLKYINYGTETYDGPIEATNEPVFTVERVAASNNITIIIHHEHSLRLLN